jgi:hypothetical protein
MPNSIVAVMKIFRRNKESSPDHRDFAKLGFYVGISTTLRSRPFLKGRMMSSECTRLFLQHQGPDDAAVFLYGFPLNLSMTYCIDSFWG